MDIQNSWLQDLKIGDKVIVSSSFNKPIEKRYYDAEVVSLAKNGDISVVYVNQIDKHKFKFDKNGNQKGVKFYPDRLIQMK